jgi:hypothetical protein
MTSNRLPIGLIYTCLSRRNQWSGISLIHDINQLINGAKIPIPSTDASWIITDIKPIGSLVKVIGLFRADRNPNAKTCPQLSRTQRQVARALRELVCFVPSGGRLEPDVPDDDSCRSHHLHDFPPVTVYSTTVVLVLVVVVVVVVSSS